MPVPLECPDVACWEGLFNDLLPPDQQERYERHLESCPACQERLNQTEVLGDAFQRLGQELGDPTTAPAEPLLSQFLNRLHEGRDSERITSIEATDLFFLQPTDRTDILGTLGAYEVAAVIGQGGMGVVLKAFEPALHRLVAIKVMAAAIAGSAVARRRFTREAQAAAAACHEHIVAVHGVFEMDGLPYLVMQYVAGESLQTRLDRTGPLEVAEIVRIGLQTASGLAAAHAQGLIHRDIKPANLLLENGVARVKITDFGLARMTDDVQLTQNGVVSGTPEYMAPEQARGEHVDHRADLFSLGSVLYVMCTGMPPFSGSSTVAVLRHVSDHEPVSVRELNPDIPEWLEALIVSLMAKNPADRLQSAGEVVAILDGYLAHLRQPETIPLPTQSLLPNRNASNRTARDYRPRVLRGFGRLPWLLLVVALVALGLGLYTLFPGGNDQPKQAGEDGEKQAKQDHLAIDFRRGLENFPNLSISGPELDSVAKTDSKGLRITQPAGRANSDEVKLELPCRLKGNFDVVLGYELLAVGEPIPQYGAGLGLRLWFDSPNALSAVLSRRRRPHGETFAAHRRLKGPDDKEQYLDNKEERALKSKGQLQFVRTGSRLEYFIADEGEKPRVMHSVDIGTADVQKIQVTCNSMYTPITLDVRLTELDIQADKIPNLSQLAHGESGQAPVPAEHAERSYWLVAVEILGLGFTLALLSALGVWLYLRQSRRLETMAVHAPIQDTKDGKSEAKVSVIAFSCATCGKSLRAKAELAGKKVKCSQCGKAALVPASRANEAGGITL